MSIMDQQNSIIADLSSGREKFLALVADIRPQLYRYCRHHKSVSPDFSCGEKAKQVGGRVLFVLKLAVSLLRRIIKAF